MSKDRGRKRGKKEGEKIAGLENGRVAWADYHSLDSCLQRYRVFIWRRNLLPQTLYGGVTLKSTCDKSLYIKNTKKQVGYITATEHIGKCTAKARVGWTLDPFTPIDSVISPGAFGLINEYQIPPGYTFGAIYEFEFDAGKCFPETPEEIPLCPDVPCSFELRDVITTNPSLNKRNILGDPISLEETYPETHPRGVWSFAATITSLPEYQIGSGLRYYRIVNGQTDDIYNESRSRMQSYGVKHNLGHYGSNYFVRFKLKNTYGISKQVKVYIFETQPSDASNERIFIGAFRNDKGDVYGVPPIKLSTPSNQQMVLMDTYNIPANSTAEKQIIIHVGGNSSGPFGILIRTV